jgi:peptidoglycan/LPS O-acetylase OafA/YrhL
MSQPPLSNASPRIASAHFPALDGLRALAILLVIPHNVSVLSAPLSAFVYPIGILTNVGWVGVQLFFALSGFLISGNLLDSRQSSNYYRAFFGRRVLRIFPLYYGMLILLLIVVPLLGLAPPELTASMHHQLWLWLFLTNWFAPLAVGVAGFGHFWSLAIEEQFYLLWPGIVRHCAAPRLIRVCLFLIVAALAGRLIMMAMGASHEALYMFTICRMDALAAGAAAAAMLRVPNYAEQAERHNGLIFMSAIAILLIGAAVTRAYAINGAVTQSIGYTILSVGFAAIVGLGALPAPRHMQPLWKLLSSAPLRLVGRYSYAMYVLHLPLHLFVGLPLLHRLAPHLSSGIALVYIAAVIALTFGLSAMSYRYFERPFLSMKHRFVPDRTAPATVAEPSS